MEKEIFHLSFDISHLSFKNEQASQGSLLSQSASGFL